MPNSRRKRLASALSDTLIARATSAMVSDELRPRRTVSNTAVRKAECWVSRCFSSPAAAMNRATSASTRQRRRIWRR